MLTNLDFLKAGQPWPPKSEVPRLSRYAKHKKLFENRLLVDPKVYSFYQNIMGQYHHESGNFSFVPYGILINVYRKVSYKTADFLFIETPEYIAKDENDQDTINSIVENSKLNSIGHQGAIDASRYGDSVYVVEVGDQGESKGKGKLAISQPKYWFPVVDPSDRKKITHHVLAWRAEAGTDRATKEKLFKLVYRIHEIGKVTSGEKALKDRGTKIGKQSEKPEVKKTKLDDFAVITPQNVLTSDTIFGHDDYADLIPLTRELETRFAQIAKVLDKHSDPSLSGPMDALEFDEKTGEYKIKLGGYFARDNKDSPPVEYITWNGQLEASFMEIDKILNLLAIISEMGPAIFEADTTKIGNISGRALKLMYVNVLAKVARIRNSFDPEYKKGIALSSQLGYGKPIKKKDIGITWKDGLPNDPLEMAEIGQLRTSKATDTIVNQIMVQDGLTKEQAEEKALIVEAEQAEGIPGMGTGQNFLDILGDDSDGQEGAQGAQGDGETPKNIAASEGLNGAQITAALNVFERLSAGTLARGVAVELLISVGIGQVKAEKMVGDQAEIKLAAE